MTSTTTTIGGEPVQHGDTIRDFRGDTWTFDYEHDGLIYVTEKPNGFYPRVFVERVDGDE